MDFTGVTNETEETEETEEEVEESIYPVGSPSHPYMVELSNNFVYVGDNALQRKVSELLSSLANELTSVISQAEVVPAVEALVDCYRALYPEAETEPEEVEADWNS